MSGGVTNAGAGRTTDAGVTVKVTAPEVPLTFCTVTLNVPGEPRNEPGMTAVRLEPFRNVVVSAVVPKNAVLGLTKFCPVKVIVRLPEPTAMEFGLMLVSVGAGGGGGGGCVIVKVRAFDVPLVF